MKNILVLFSLIYLSGCNYNSDNPPFEAVIKTDSSKLVKSKHEIIIKTFLGNDQRNYYGENPSSALNVKWKKYLGWGRTGFSDKKWYGAGWTGQPLLTSEYDTLYLYQGSFDHNIKKINAETGELIWEYDMNDIIKGTGSIYVNPLSKNEIPLSIIQGSRRGEGNSLSSESCYSLRSVSLATGKEEWRYNVTYSGSRSRDVDASPLVINDKIFAALENGLMAILNPSELLSENKFNFPTEITTIELFEKKNKFGRNIVEASPVLLNNVIYIPSENGNIYGIEVSSKQIIFNYRIGSDLDGTPSVTNDSCLLVAVEKQHIPGYGGVLKLNLSDTVNTEEWFFPVKNRNFEDWAGGVIGSVSTLNNHCVFTSIEGTLYLVDHTKFSGETVLSPDMKKKLRTPVLLDKKYIGPSISTPIIIDNKIVACTYTGIYLFEITFDYKLNLLDKFITGFESTPICFNGKIYVASRDGNLYCFSD
ncbi:MAG: PQQ-binding-like beta-propeller repeat protein [Ignavibacteria bacterium]|nr:PQQ-binding-like beta-propeller repeat protein [Ignavibacteria bacterium]